MEKSRFDQLKEIVFYAPLGVIKVIRANASTVFSLIVNQGKSATTSPVPNDEQSQALVESSVPRDLRRKAREGVREIFSDARKQKEWAQSAIGSFGFIKDNMQPFSATFQERGKKDMDVAVGKMHEKIPKPITKNRSEDIPESSDSFIGQTVNIATSLFGNTISLGGKTVQASFSLAKKGIGVTQAAVGKVMPTPGVDVNIDKDQNEEF